MKTYEIIQLNNKSIVVCACECKERQERILDSFDRNYKKL